MLPGSRANKDRSSAYSVVIADQQSRLAVDHQQLSEAVRSVLRNSELESASVSLAIVDDPTIHELNRRFLDHDWPTDVLSFVLDNKERHLEGEIVISADTTAAAAEEAGWPVEAELLLYVIHGTLHLVGYDDKTPAEAQVMRAAESSYLSQFGFAPSAGVDNLPANDASATGNALGRQGVP
jgi:probable rRNA maturation factor